MKILKKENFEYDVAAIGSYVDQVGGELLAKALIGATTPSYVNVRLGINGTQALNLLNSTVLFQSGTCGFQPTGSTTTFTQHNITTCQEKYNEELCYKDLFETFQSMLMASKSSTQESVPFEQQIADLKVKQIQQRIEKQLWQGSTGATGDTNACFDGLKLLISTGTTGVAVSVSGTAFNAAVAYGTAGNPRFEVDKLINALSDDAMSRDDLRVFMSYANFRKYVQSLTQGNYFQNYIGSTDITGMMEAIHPNTNVKVVPTIGLNGSNQVVIGPAEYIVVGFGLLADHEKLTIWYSKDFDTLRLRANYNYGVTIATFGSTAYFATNNLA
jgi:hypothetical protein